MVPALLQDTYQNKYHPPTPLPSVLSVPLSSPSTPRHRGYFSVYPSKTSSIRGGRKGLHSPDNQPNLDSKKQNHTSVLLSSSTSPSSSSPSSTSSLFLRPLSTLSITCLVLVIIIQFLFSDGTLYAKFPQRYSPTSSSPSARLDLGQVCESPHPFPTEPPLSRPHKMPLIQEARRIAAEFDFTDEDVQKSVKEFIRQMDEGLEKNGTTMSQIPTYVTGVPNGTEKGLYLAVDLGGTNFRVCSIKLNGDSTFSLTQSKVAIPRELMVANTAKELFAFLAKQIEAFLKAHHGDHFEAHVRRRQSVTNKEVYRDRNYFRLGFTFSFPVEQTGINSGNLIRWTKGFNIADAIGKDVCALLQEEIDILKLPVLVAALVNDTVGTLMSRSYTSPGKTPTLLGAIFGTGTNGAYVEKLSKITKPVSGDFDKSTGLMVVNTEWGSFDNELRVLPKTPYDEQLDHDSVNPGIQMFEKRISGMFLGEILRVVLVNVLKNKDIALFRDDNSSHNDFHSTTTISDNSPLYTQWAVDSSILSIAESDNSAGLRVLRQEIDRSLGVSAGSLEDAQFVKEVAHAIGRRAARLAAVAIGAIVLESGRLEPVLSNLNGTTTASGASIVRSLSGLHLAEAAKSTVSKIASSASTLISSAQTDGNQNAGNKPTVLPQTDELNEDEIIDIGVDGSLVEFYPDFEALMREALRAVPGIGVEGEKRIRIGIAKDGSGVGAALIALVAGQMDKAENGAALGKVVTDTLEKVPESAAE